MVKVPCPTGHPCSASEEVKEFMPEKSFALLSTLAQKGDLTPILKSMNIDR